jgi:hypothetical protein
LRPAFEVADVLNTHWLQTEQHPKINSWQLRILGAIKRCRTSELGGHIDACTSCGTVRISYNSCRNRHCPKCQGREREAWIQKRQQELLPVPYFHVVFTLPDILNQLAMHQPKAVYDALFEAAWGTIKTFGYDPKHLGAQTGMIAILHTWGQQLSLHPHLHCIVPGGGLTIKKNLTAHRQIWKVAKSKGRFLFPVKAMSAVFRAKYVAALKKKLPDINKSLVDKLFKKNWVVYAKRPFGNAHSVIEYLGRYTHKIAISNHRIINIDKNNITFSYKDYRKGAQKQEMTLSCMEFIRRFSMHILPKSFVRIRHYGILSSTGKRNSLPVIREQTLTPVLAKSEPRALTQLIPKLCPHCKTETMVTIEILPKRGPPGMKNWEWIKSKMKSQTGGPACLSAAQAP